MIRFTCPSCGRTLSVPASSAGKQSRCPGCNAVSQAPASKPKSLRPSERNARPCCALAESFDTIRVSLLPQGRADRRLVGRKSSQMPTLRRSATHPRLARQPPHRHPPRCRTSGGLTPLGPADGSTPLPSGGMDDLFAGPPDLSAPNKVHSGGLGGGNPFSSAGGTGGWAGERRRPTRTPPLPAARPRSAGHTNKPKRSGSPWDDREHEESPFWATVKMVLFSPTQAFYRMRAKAGEAARCCSA